MREAYSEKCKQLMDVKRSWKKIFEFVFDPLKFDFQIPAGLNSVKSVLWLQLTAVTDARRYKSVKVPSVP